MSEWSKCPRGEVGQLVRNLRRRHQKQIWLQSAGITAGLLLMIGIAGWWFQSESHPKLACREVRELTNQFVAGELDEQFNQRMVVHLKRCPRCVEYVQREHPGFHVPLIESDNQNHASRTHIAAPLTAAMPTR